MMLRALACLAFSLLSGCFSSANDLIGNHALRLERFDSLVTFNGWPYRIDATPEGYVACELTLKTHFPDTCNERYLVRFDRTTRGNMIVQARGIDASDWVFLLMVRNAPSSMDGCFYLLGEAGGTPGSPRQKAEEEIADKGPNSLETREQLLEVIDAYEKNVLPLDSACDDNKVVIMSPDDLVFEGDNPAATNLK